MTGLEKGKARKGPEGPRILIPSLVPPYPGVFDEVNSEYNSNPSRFLVALGHRMNSDNPNLLDYIDQTKPMQEDPMSVKWAAIYYELFARSAKKVGAIPMPIADEIIEEYHGSRVKESLVRMTWTADRIREWHQREEERHLQRRTRDESFSPELQKFWKMVDKDIAFRISFGAPQIVGNILKLDVQSLQFIMQEQQDTYLMGTNKIH